MAKKDLYAILGVGRTASVDEIKKTYRQLARKYHPDVNQGNKQAEERFKEISFAHDVLTDTQKRKLYDEFGEDGLQAGFNAEQMRAYRQWNNSRSSTSRPRGNRTAAGSASPGFEDIFGDIFGNFGRSGNRTQQQNVAPAEDLEYVLDLSLLDAIRGANPTITIQRPSPCPTCHGTGGRAGRQSTACSECSGQGQVRVGAGPMAFFRTCARCGGSGRLSSGGCTNCNGSGRTATPERLTVKIPAGVDEGTRIRLAGKGATSSSGGPAGDLYLEIRIQPHPTLTRKGLDLYLDVPITIGEAIGGASITVPTPHGDVKLKVPPSSQSGQVLRLKSKGITEAKTNTSGDFYVKLMIQIPQKLSDSLHQAVDQLERCYTDSPRKDLHL